MFEMGKNLIDKIKARTSLETRLKVHLQLGDNEHWDNGIYSGDITEELNYILNMVKDWVKDGAKLRN